jgi:hypothetical protein
MGAPAGVISQAIKVWPDHSTLSGGLNEAPQ